MMINKLRKSAIYICFLLYGFLGIQIVGISLIMGKLESLDKSLESTNQELNYIRANQTIDVESINAGAKMIETEEIISEAQSLELPDCDTSFKCYMDYRAITDESSEQYKLQQLAYTDTEGFRRINDDYVVALGTYYTDNCGDRFKITFDTGVEITVIVGDIKQDNHTDSLNMYSPVYDENGNFISGNVVEFIVDTDTISQRAKLLGSVEAYGKLKGNVTAVERIDQT